MTCRTKTMLPLPLKEGAAGRGANHSGQRLYAPLPPTPPSRGGGEWCVTLMQRSPVMNEMSHRVLTPPMTGSDEQERPRHQRAGPFGVLDIGTTKIACLIGRTESDGTLRVLGFGWQKGRGVRGGCIVDLDDAEHA